LTPVEYCNKKIKEASEAADIKAFLAYTEMLTVWQRIEDDKKALSRDG
tara:strand:+ start:1677 stop:1820 length:144 start_codon:yes stop_codon:yes gene_type:complete